MEDELKKVRRLLRDEESKLARDARFLATTIARASVDPVLFGRRFDAVLYDEVGMALVPQVVLASVMAHERMCCFGDFRQLPPIVDERVPELKGDIFDRLGIVESVDGGWPHDLLVMLTEQRRFHPEIASFVGEELYGGLLETNREAAKMSTLRSREYCGELGPMALVDLSKMPSLCLRDSKSHYNLMSASVCVDLAVGMPDDWRVAIITPYRSQAGLVNAMLRDRLGGTERVRGATVHGFQGSEAEAVIFDVVDCAPRDSLGMLLRDNRGGMADRLLNVAITRAKYKFVMVANLAGMQDIFPPEELLLRRLMDAIAGQGGVVSGNAVLSLLNGPSGQFYIRGSAEGAWNRLVEDIEASREEVLLVLARSLSGTPTQINQMVAALVAAVRRGVRVEVYGKAARELPPCPGGFVGNVDGLPNTALAIVDGEIAWNGLPCSWLSSHSGTRMAYDPVFRYVGGHTAREVGRMFCPRIERAQLGSDVTYSDLGGLQLSLKLDGS